MNEATALKETNSATAACLRVLVVDDNEASAKTMGWAKEMLGHQIKLAHNGSDAIRISDEFVPQLVLLDIGLPGMNGYEICQRLQQNPKLAKTIFVAQTGWGEEKHRESTKAAGFHHHLVKPVPLEMLEELLTDIQPQLAS